MRIGITWRQRRVAAGTFVIIQAVLAAWWAAFYPGLFSRDSVLYLSHTTVGPWVSDHSVLYDAILWASYRTTGDLGVVTLVQTTAMAGALTYLASALRALGAPRWWTTATAVLLPFLPPVGAFAVTLWKDVPFSICAVTIAGVCAGLAARRRLTGLRLTALGALLLALGLFRANGFLIVLIAVAVLIVVVVGGKGVRIRLAVVGLVTAAVPVLLNSLVFPLYGIQAPSKTYVYHTAFGDIAVLYRDHPELFTGKDRQLMSAVAPLTRWREGGTCYSINPLIWRADFSWPQADAHAGELLSLWERLLFDRPELVIDARLCRGSIAWRPYEDETVPEGGTYHFSLARDADDYVGLGKVADFPGRWWIYTLRPKSWELYRVANPWLLSTYSPQLDWLLWRGAFWSYASYLVVGLAALAMRNRRALAVIAIVAGQQLAVLANISSQDFRYMAAPVFIGMLALPLLGAAVHRLLGRDGRTRDRQAAVDRAGQAADTTEPLRD